MSIKALNWAWSQADLKSSPKFVLVAIADWANEAWESYPSISGLCEKTSLDRKTVIAALLKLEELGLIVDTGERRGQTKQVKVYRLQQPEDTQIRNHSKNGTVPIIPANSPVFPSKESQKRDTEPPYEPPIEPPISRQAATATVTADAATKIDVQQIISLYHECCPSLPAVKLLSDGRKQAIKHRWRQAAVELDRYSTNDTTAGLAWWRKFFSAVEASDFLTGRSGNSFSANLDWILKQSNFTKIIEGNYVNRRRAA